MGGNYAGVEYYWGQSRLINKQQYSFYSLEILLGVVGGLSAMIWGILSVCFAGYEEFKFHNSLFGQNYPTMRTSYDSENFMDKSLSE